MNPQIPPYQQGGIEGKHNRANEVRRDNDLVKIPEITLYDIDYAIFYHLSNTLGIRINDGGNMIPVPCMFANGEKWAQIRRHGYMRDHDKKAMAPVIVIKRTGVVTDERIYKLDMNHYEPGIKIFPYRTFNMQYDRVSGQHVTKPSYEFHVLTLPDYVRVSYEIVVWTDLTEQMNSVLQTIQVSSEHVWGDYHKFRTVVQDITHNDVNTPGDDRLIKATLSLQVDGYLRSAFEYQQSNIQKQYSLKRVLFTAERSEHEYLSDPVQTQNNTPHLTEEPLETLEKNSRRNIRYW